MDGEMGGCLMDGYLSRWIGVFEGRLVVGWVNGWMNSWVGG